MSIVEHRTYTLKPEFGPGDYFALYDGEPRALQVEILQGLAAYFASEIGRLNVVTSLWIYPSFEARLERRTLLARHPRWQAFLTEVRPLLQGMENQLLVPASFSPLK